METPINYIDKYGLNEALRELMYPVYEKFLDGVGTWYVRGDQDLANEINTFISLYDGVSKLKKVLIEELKVIGVDKLNEIYGGDIVFSNVGEVQLLLDIDATYTRDGSPAARLVQVSQTLNRFKSKRNEINAIDDEESLKNYDLKAGW